MSESKQNSPESFETPIPNSGKVSEETSPSVKSHKFLIVGLVLLLLLTAGAAAYVFAQNQSLKSQLGLPGFKLGYAKTCDYNGETYQAGEGFTASDGCNSCSCTETGQVACTAMACDDENNNDFLIPDPNERLNWKLFKSEEYEFSYPSDAKLSEKMQQQNLTMITSQNPEYILTFSSDSHSSICANGPCDQQNEAKVFINGTNQPINIVWPDAWDNYNAQVVLQNPSGQDTTFTIHAQYKTESTLPLITSILSTFEFSDTVDQTSSNQEKIKVKLAVFNEDSDNCSSTSYVERNIPKSDTPLKDTLELLLTDKLTTDEQKTGYRNMLSNDTDWPDKRIYLKSTVINNGVATITIDDPEVMTVGGSCRVGVMKSAIENTALQFPNITKVIVLPELAFQP